MLSKTVPTFKATFEKNLATFILISGHTADL